MFGNKIRVWQIIIIIIIGQREEIKSAKYQTSGFCSMKEMHDFDLVKVDFLSTQRKGNRLQASLAGAMQVPGISHHWDGPGDGEGRTRQTKQEQCFLFSLPLRSLPPFFWHQLCHMLKGNARRIWAHGYIQNQGLCEAGADSTACPCLTRGPRSPFAIWST